MNESMKNDFTKITATHLCPSVHDRVSCLPPAQSSLPFNLESTYFGLMFAAQWKSLLGCV